MNVSSALSSLCFIGILLQTTPVLGNSSLAVKCSQHQRKTICGTVKKCWKYKGGRFCFRKCQKVLFKTCAGKEIYIMKQVIWKREHQHKVVKRSSLKTIYRYFPGYRPNRKPLVKFPIYKRLPSIYRWDYLHDAKCITRCDASALANGTKEQCNKRWLSRKVCYLSRCALWRGRQFCKINGCRTRRIWNRCFADGVKNVSSAKVPA